MVFSFFLGAAPASKATPAHSAAMVSARSLLGAGFMARLPAAAARRCSRRDRASPVKWAAFPAATSPAGSAAAALAAAELAPAILAEPAPGCFREPEPRHPGAPAPAVLLPVRPATRRRLPWEW